MFGLVLRCIAPNTGVIGVTLALILVVKQIMDEGLPDSWGSLMLVELYKDLHQIIY